MVQTWSSWKRYPDAHEGGHVEAPIGPGVYEVRSASTGRVVAFGHARNVANAITDLKGTSKNSMPLGPVRVCCPDGMIQGD